MNLESKIRGGIYGLLVGDALGVPYEFTPPEKIPQLDVLSYQSPANFQRTYPNVLPGTWSDDGAQALCLLDSLVSCNGFDLIDFSRKLLAWYDSGYWAVGRQVFDCGIQTSRALSAFAFGMSAAESGFVVPDGKGNGALMRVLPLAIWHYHNPLLSSDKAYDQLILDAHQQCLITHGHIINQVSAALYSLWAYHLLDKVEMQTAYKKACNYLTGFYNNQTIFQDYSFELENLLQEGNFSGGGYVVDSFRSVKHLQFTCADYQSVILGAIRMGNDTDTTAAIAGGLAGIHYGFEGISPHLVKELREMENVENLISRFFEKRGIRHE